MKPISSALAILFLGLPSFATQLTPQSASMLLKKIGSDIQFEVELYDDYSDEESAPIPFLTLPQSEADSSFIGRIMTKITESTTSLATSVYSDVSDEGNQRIWIMDKEQSQWLFEKLSQTSESFELPLSTHPLFKDVDVVSPGNDLPNSSDYASAAESVSAARQLTAYHSGQLTCVQGTSNTGKSYLTDCFIEVQGDASDLDAVDESLGDLEDLLFKD